LDKIGLLLKTISEEINCRKKNKNDAYFDIPSNFTSKHVKTLFTLLEKEKIGFPENKCDTNTGNEINKFRIYNASPSIETKQL